jgi:AraC family transcriptional regulator
MNSFLEKVTVDCSWTKDKLAWLVAMEIKKESGNGYPRGPMFFENAAIVFITQLAYLLDKAQRQFDPIRALCDSKLSAIIEYIDVNLHRNISLSELASLADLTPRYFCGAFKQATGRPPHQFQIERRIERAKSLLNDSNLPLIDVALTVGFSSQSHLSDYFRRTVGVTPARYRSEMQKGKGLAARRD